jgi:Uma2 family endonuclease
MSTARSPRVRPVHYPLSDGKPMAETGIHAENLMDLIDVLRSHLADREAFAWGDMFVYYVEGDPKKVVAPDVFVALGVPAKTDRNVYFAWVEGKLPDLVIELTSRSTRHQDTGAKFRLYQDVLRIPEYFLFDPLEDYLKPSLQGFRLVEGHYVPIPEAGGRLRSEVLGIDFGREGHLLKLYDPETGERLLTSRQQAERAERERQRAERERRRAERERRRAERERRRVAAEARTLAEKLALADAERERLLAELERLRQSRGGG